MKTRILQILGVAAIATMGMVSCDTDACKDVECGDYGTCIDGDCECDAGYSGTNCETEDRAKFIGSYNVTEACTSGNYTYAITVTTSSTGAASVIITNFGDYSVNVNATASGNNLTIASQTVTVGGNSGTFSGSGQITGNVLTISYNLNAGTSTDACTMTCTKQ